MDLARNRATAEHALERATATVRNAGYDVNVARSRYGLTWFTIVQPTYLVENGNGDRHAVYRPAGGWLRSLDRKRRAQLPVHAGAHRAHALSVSRQRRGTRNSPRSHTCLARAPSRSCKRDT